MDENNEIIKIHTDGDHYKYKFKQSFEITINDCLIVEVLETVDGSIVLYIDISETDAQHELSDFVTDISRRVGLDKEVNISNIALDFDPKTVQTVPIVSSDPKSIENTYVDVVIDWETFHIEDNNLYPSLQLTELIVPEPYLPLDIIRGTSPNLISPADVPELYTVTKTSISFLVNTTNTFEI